MFTNEELTTIAAHLRANANETLRRMPEHGFAERLLEIAAKAEDAIIDNAPPDMPDAVADFVSFIDSRNLIRLKEESREKYLVQRDASAKNRHKTALQYDYPEVHQRLFGETLF